MDDITIDRLTLKLSGLGEAEGRRLAALICEGLARAPLGAAGSMAGSTLVVKARVDSDLGRLSNKIVGDILQRLEAGS